MNCIVKYNQEYKMDAFENNYSAMAIHKLRERELMVQAENQRNVRNLRQEINYHVRRTLRINNDPAR